MYIWATSQQENKQTYLQLNIHTGLTMEKTSEKKTKQEQKTIKNSAKLGGRRDAQDLTLKVGLGQLFAAVAAVNVCVGAQRDAADKDGRGRR